MSIQLAIIGMGVMGCKYAQMIHSGHVSGIKIAAVTRITPERKEQLKDIFVQDIPIYNSAADLFENVREGKIKLDAVLIVTPHLSHEEIAVEAMQIGLHVLCDKPSGAYRSQARRMNEEAAKQPELKFGMMFNQRMNPVFKKMKEIVSSGIYGKIRRINWIMTDWYRPESYYASGGWRGTWDKEGGGILLNQCPHNLDLLQWICGMPSSIQAFCYEGKYHNIEVEDEVTAYLQYENGATGTLYATTGEASGINRFEISLENALLVFENNELNIRELEESEAEFRADSKDMFGQPKAHWKKIEIDEKDLAHAGVLQNFADSIISESELYISGTEGIKSLTLSNAMYLSSWKGQMIHIPDNTDEETFFEKTFEDEMQKKIQ